MSAYFVPTRFTWQFGGQVVSYQSLLAAHAPNGGSKFLRMQVHLCGSFTRWVETVPMSSDESNPGVFAVVVHLPPGWVLHMH